MATTRFERFLPLAGVLAAIFFVVSDGPVFSAPSTAGSGQVAYAIAHHGRVEIAGIGAALAAFFLLFFIGAVRSALRSHEPGESTYSSVAFGAGIAYAGTLLLDSLLDMSIAKAGQAHDHASLAPLFWLLNQDWVPWAAASGVLLLALGLGGMRTLALPKPLAWVLVVLGVLSITGPTGELVFLATPVWMIVTAIVLSRRADRGRAATQPGRTPVSLP